MRCTIENCPGEYEEKNIIHTLKYKGEVIVIKNVPALVCQICGDVLIKPKTIKMLERILSNSNKSKPEYQVPLYDYSSHITD
jgi:YgiT-type zinc finger domain-containing protein